MDKKIIQQLNQLNKDFYQTVANSFNQTRQYSWAGWEQLFTEIKKLAAVGNREIKVLDLGCGNARFLDFLIQNFSQLKWNYCGLDTDEQLLNFAKEKNWPTKIKVEFQQLDIVDKLNNNKNLIEDSYHLIVGFGLMHHLPSYNLRKKLVEIIQQHLLTNGLVALSFWQFATDERFKQRFINSEIVNIKASELEDNDYILDWRKETKAYRFCHWVNETEVVKLVNDTGLKTLKTFYADGKSGKLNYYWVGQR